MSGGAAVPQFLCHTTRACRELLFSLGLSAMFIALGDPVNDVNEKYFGKPVNIQCPFAQCVMILQPEILIWP